MSQTSALFQLGMDLDQGSSTAQKEDWGNSRDAGHSRSDARYDHFTVKDGVRCAGTHLILDLYDAQGLDDLELMERALRDCVTESGATLLHIHLHHFTPNGGISGVAVLAESHISVHSWPETGFAAFDVFMCGDAEPERCIEVLRAAFCPAKLAVSEHLRGQGA